MTTTSTRTPSGPISRKAAVKQLIARRPMISFFVLAYSLSWLAWIPYILSRSGMSILDFDFPKVLGTTQLTGMLPGAYLGPILSAFLVTRIAYGPEGVRAWLGRFSRWRVSWIAYLAVIAGVPLGLTAAGSVISLFGGQPVRPPTILILLAYVPMLALQMITTGLAEEPGWRDFALPQLQRRFGPLRGSLILGPLWGCWHLPLFLTSWGSWPDFHFSAVVEFVVLAMAICIVMTWVFNKTGQSLPLQMILHSSINTYASIVWTGLFPAMDHAEVTRGILLAAGTAAVILLIVTRGRLGVAERAAQRPRTLS